MDVDWTEDPEALTCECVDAPQVYVFSLLLQSLQSKPLLRSFPKSDTAISLA